MAGRTTPSRNFSAPPVLKPLSMFHICPHSVHRNGRVAREEQDRNGNVPGWGTAGKSVLPPMQGRHAPLPRAHFSKTRGPAPCNQPHDNGARLSPARRNSPSAKQKSPSSRTGLNSFVNWDAAIRPSLPLPSPFSLPSSPPERALRSRAHPPTRESRAGRRRPAVDAASRCACSRRGVPSGWARFR